MTGRTTAFVFAFLFAFMSFTACAEAGEEAADGVTAGTEAETEPELSALNILDRFENADMDGRTMRVMTSNSINGTIYAQTAPEEHMTADIVNDALWERDRMLETKFNARILYILKETDEGLLYGSASKSVTAADDSFDVLIGSVTATSIPMMNKGFLFDLARVPHLDFSNPWWNRNIADAFAVSGVRYLGVGDFSPRNMLSANVLIFNLRKFDDRGLTYPYADVREGKWTLDRFLALIKDAAADTDGDGMIGTGDFFGLNCDSTAVHSFYYGCGQTLVSMADGGPVINCTTDRAYTVIEKLGGMFASADVDASTYKKDTYGPNNSFMSGNALFNCMVVIDLTTFRDCEDDYGVLPLPKYDGEQKNYYANANCAALAALTVPKTLPEQSLEDIGLFTEAMTALSRYKGIPEAFENTLLTKLTRDEDSVEMLRLAADSLTLDLGYAFDMGGIKTALRESVEKNTGFAAKIASIEEKIRSEAEALAGLYGAE